MSKVLKRIFLSYKYNNRKALLSNFKAVDQMRAELHILDVGKVDVCRSPLFANSVIHYFCCCQDQLAISWLSDEWVTNQIAS